MTPSLEPNVRRSVLAIALILTGCTGSTVPRPKPDPPDDATGGSGSSATGGATGNGQTDAAPSGEPNVTPDAAVVKADSAPAADLRADLAPASTGDARPSPN